MSTVVCSYVGETSILGIHVEVLAPCLSNSEYFFVRTLDAESNLLDIAIQNGLDVGIHCSGNYIIHFSTIDTALSNGSFQKAKTFRRAKSDRKYWN